MAPMQCMLSSMMWHSPSLSLHPLLGDEWATYFFAPLLHPVRCSFYRPAHRQLRTLVLDAFRNMSLPAANFLAGKVALVTGSTSGGSHWRQSAPDHVRVHAAHREAIGLRI